MIKDFKNGEIVEDTYYELRFYVDECGGFAFLCDKDGNVIFNENTTEAAIENYHWCMEHPEKFPYYFNHVVKQVHRYREPNSGTCHCGEKIALVNEYLGACECPKCGQWYNLWGQELKNPETWSDGDDW